jgi:predicted CoA-substrate-specific enzyme activase
LLTNKISDTGVNILDNVRKILDRASFDRLVATGYGRYLAQAHLDCPIITEIKAYALGAHHLYPECEVIIDIGGQDSKVIRASGGRVLDFEMNDRCAAGTGRFLEVMATTLGYSIDELGSCALRANHAVTINSMCTVFAESEVISLLSKGEQPQNIALGVHNSIINRIFALSGRVDLNNDVVFAGGVAKNPCMVELLKKKLRKDIFVPDEPQIIGAIGAALAADNDMPLACKEVSSL